MRNILKKLASRLPLLYQQEMKRVYFGRQIRKGTFKAEEQEFHMLAKWVQSGDCVLDIGANVGHYTNSLSNLVGVKGRVIAFEPVPYTFEILASNVTKFHYKNVTLLNVAASQETTVLGIYIPMFDTGLNNYYMAQLTNGSEELSVLCLPIDSLNISQSISLAKMDVEGHEISVLIGMRHLLKRDHPLLIVEGDSDEVAAYLKDFGYSFEKLKGSSNRIYQQIVDM